LQHNCCAAQADNAKADNKLLQLADVACVIANGAVQPGHALHSV
jgi:hypothetical protein